MGRYGVALLVPPGDAHSLAWWRKRAERTLAALLDDAGRTRRGIVHLEVEHGEIAKVSAWCESRPGGE